MIQIARRPFLSALLVITGFGGSLFLERALAAPTPPAAESEPRTALGSARELSVAFQQVAHEVSQAVVSVQAEEMGSRRERGGQRLGSGVILRPDGLAVTNYHVVRDTVDLHVVLEDGRRRSAAILGTDPDTDLAILDVDGDGYVSAALEAERLPEIGEWVLAIGNPQGLSHSVTAGIISARGRVDLDLTTFEDYLQTDAAINPGNSGGPLVDLDGRIVGINTAMGTVSSGGNGLGFAIPGHIVRFVVDGILREGRVRRGFLGVTMDDVPAHHAQRLGYDRRGLVRVDEVQDGSPAERVGLAVDDVILAVQGSEVYDPKVVMNLIAELGPGAEMQLEILRNGEVQGLSVFLEERGMPPARLAELR